MKLSDLVPGIPEIVQKEQQLNYLTGILSEVNLQKSGNTSRAPTLGVDQAVVNSWLRQQMAYRQQMITDLITLSMTIEEIRSPILRIVGEVFRKGFEWEPKFAKKCEKCGLEFTVDVEVCEECREKGHEGKVRNPDETQKDRIDLFRQDCNVFDQSLEEVFRQFHFSVNAVDDGFIYIAKEYLSEENSEKIRSKVIEIRHLNPAMVELDLDEDGLPKNAHYICYLHREEAHSDSGSCDKCGRTLVPAMYKYWDRGAAMFLTDSEVIHMSKFNPSETYGWSPILTVFEKALSIRGMDSFVYRYFFERRMPASMVMVFTDNPESLRREREQIAARTRQDPNYVPMVAVSSRGNRGRVDMVRLFHTLQEMDYLPVREEIRERISAMWGVTPAWQGAPEAFGGLSTQTQQLVVMSRVVESDQRMFHEKVFPLILEAFGVTDWTWELPQPEEKAEATRISFAQQRVSVANMLVQMGFDVKIKSREVGIDDVNFSVSGEAQNPNDMYGGMMGGGMGGGEEGGEEGEEEGDGGEGNDEVQIQYMEKAVGGWMDQITEKGFVFPLIKNVSRAGDSITFESNRGMYKAVFAGGKLLEIEKLKPTRLHSHDGHPPHDINMPHEGTLIGHKERREKDDFDPENPVPNFEDLDI